MAHPVKLLAFSGSTRAASFTKRLIHGAADAAKNAGADVTLIDLADYPMPIYNGDLEERAGLPEHCVQLRTLIKAQDGLLIATPEYNGFFPALLKNTLDWVSRPYEDDGLCACYAGKVVGLLGASPGRLGALRAVTVLRQQMSNIGCHVHPDAVTVSEAHTVLGGDGPITDERTLKSINRLVTATIMLAGQTAA